MAGEKMPKKRGFPDEGELVVCKITRLNPNSAFAYLEEYDKEGMIHISEIVSGWIRDIRNHLKPNQMVVAKVIHKDEEKGYINLSLKRLTEQQKKERMKDYKLEQKAEKMFELAEKEMKQNGEKVGFLLQEKFGSLFSAFKTSIERPNLLEERGIPKKWVDVIAEIAKKNIELKEFKYSARLVAKTYKPEGIKNIREMLEKISGLGIGVKYISAPNYMITYSSKSKKANKEFDEKKDKIVAVAKEFGIDAVIEDA